MPFHGGDRAVEVLGQGWRPGSVEDDLQIEGTAAMCVDLAGERVRSTLQDPAQNAAVIGGGQRREASMCHAVDQGNPDADSRLAFRLSICSHILSHWECDGRQPLRKFAQRWE